MSRSQSAPLWVRHVFISAVYWFAALNLGGLAVVMYGDCAGVPGAEVAACVAGRRGLGAIVVALIALGNVALLWRLRRRKAPAPR